jgi:short subunit fatty acids transporter
MVTLATATLRRLTAPDELSARTAQDLGASVSSTVFAMLAGVHSAFSAGGEWSVEAPHAMAAANGARAHLGSTAMVYTTAETLPHPIHPFGTPPLFGIPGFRGKDLISRRRSS